MHTGILVSLSLSKFTITWHSPSVLIRSHLSGDSKTVIMSNTKSLNHSWIMYYDVVFLYHLAFVKIRLMSMPQNSNNLPSELFCERAAFYSKNFAETTLKLLVSTWVCPRVMASTSMRQRIGKASWFSSGHYIRRNGNGTRRCPYVSNMWTDENCLYLNAQWPSNGSQTSRTRPVRTQANNIC